MSIKFRASSLIVTAERKNTGTMLTRKSRLKAAVTGLASIHGQPSISRAGFKEEQTRAVFDVFYITQSDSLICDEPTKKVYELFQEAIQPYC